MKGIRLSDTLTERDGKKLPPGVYEASIAAFTYFITLMEAADADSTPMVIKFLPMPGDPPPGIHVMIYLDEPRILGSGDNRFSESSITFDVVIDYAANAEKRIFQALAERLLPAIQHQREVVQYRLMVMGRSLDVATAILGRYGQQEK